MQAFWFSHCGIYLKTFFFKVPTRRGRWVARPSERTGTTKTTPARSFEKWSDSQWGGALEKRCDRPHRGVTQLIVIQAMNENLYKAPALLRFKLWKSPFHGRMTPLNIRLNQFFWGGFRPQFSACALLWAKLGLAKYAYLGAYLAAYLGAPNMVKWAPCSRPLCKCANFGAVEPRNLGDFWSNFNGKISQKFDLVITFDWRVLLT